MAHYTVSFTLSSARDDYQEVYQSLMDAVEDEATDRPWKETSSFLAFKSHKGTKALMKAIYLGSKLLESKDVLLLINTTQGEFSVKGAKYPNTLEDRLGLTEV